MPVSNERLLAAACCMMGLDGEICRPNSSFLHRLAEHAGIQTQQNSGEPLGENTQPPSELDEMLRRVAEDHDFYQQQMDVLIADPERAIGAALRVAAAEGSLADIDRISVRHLADRLGMNPARTEEVLRLVRVELGLESPPEPSEASSN
jgi:hypothetical protein